MLRLFFFSFRNIPASVRSRLLAWVCEALFVSFFNFFVCLLLCMQHFDLSLALIGFLLFYLLQYSLFKSENFLLHQDISGFHFCLLYRNWKIVPAMNLVSAFFIIWFFSVVFSCQEPRDEKLCWIVREGAWFKHCLSIKPKKAFTRRLENGFQIPDGKNDSRNTCWKIRTSKYDLEAARRSTATKLWTSTSPTTWYKSSLSWVHTSSDKVSVLLLSKIFTLKVSSLWNWIDCKKDVLEIFKMRVNR